VNRLALEMVAGTFEYYLISRCLSSRTRHVWLGSRGEKHIERDTIIAFDFEKLNAHRVVSHPLYSGEKYFHGRLVPGKSQHEGELLARPEQAIDTESGPLT
jgi:hypothetical protein